ncbi:MAG: 50S ribosomal protein L15 [FCB group bacterium]|nr:50S ribosomal protein L15 [FCB group bacterium]
MELHTLKPSDGSKKKRKRLGRGTGSGWGKTSGRGHKGARSRSGFKRKRGHEGGQMPLSRRVPKRGFTNIFKKEFQLVNLTAFAKCQADEINSKILKDAGIIKKLDVPVKILGMGNVDKAYMVKAQAFSKSAKEKIEAAGGKTEVLK